MANSGSGTVGEYTTSGATVNDTLITGLSNPMGVTVTDTNLFVANYGSGTVGEYTTAGATVNASLITGLSNPTSVTPEPGTLALLGMGGLSALLVRRYRK